MGRNISVSNADIATYHRDGAVLLKGALQPEELLLVERGVDEVYADPGKRSSVTRGADGGGETLVKTSPSEQSASLREFLALGVAAEIAGRIMQTPSAQLVFEQMFYKTKGRNLPTPWHQDTAFLRVRGYDMCRVWISCDPSPADITVQMVRGSHRWNVVYSTQIETEKPIVSADAREEFNYNNLGDPNLPIAPDVARYRDSFDIVTFDVEPGDALVFQGNMLHGSTGREQWDLPRRAFTTMWGGPDLRYHEPDGKAFPVPGRRDGDPIPNGAPIGRYEAAFPLGWRA